MKCEHTLAISNLNAPQRKTKHTHTHETLKTFIKNNNIHIIIISLFIGAHQLSGIKMCFFARFEFMIVAIRVQCNAFFS